MSADQLFHGYVSLQRELRSALPIRADQAWFWKEHWQAREREVDTHVTAGEVAVHGDVDEFLAHVDAVAGADPATPWPASLRVKSVHGTFGVLEMTWSFASPDGRATFELVTVGDELRCRWRRVGGHDVFKKP